MGKETRQRLVKRLAGICLTASILLFGGHTASVAESFLPSWQVGDRWRVEVVQRMPTGSDGWSAPVAWEYRVDAVETRENERVYVVAVAPASGDSGRGARLWYRCADRSLAAVEVRGRKDETVMGLAFDTPIPVTTERSAIPFDSPLFSADIPSSKRYRTERTIGGGFSKSVSLTQETARWSGTVAFCPSVAGDDLIEIRCTQDGKVSFVQYWRKGCPWALCGDNGNLRYRLVTE